MQGGTGGSALIPDNVLDSATRTLKNIEELETRLPEFLSMCDTDVLAEMPPLQRAQALLLIAKASTTLFTLRLRCSGLHPDDHPVKSEHERLRLYQEKLDGLLGLSKAPLRPSTTLNYQAASRFIEHSLPDLTPEQRQSLHSISREGPKINYLERTLQKKRKYQSSEKQSVQSAAKEFLEKASRELLGNNKGSFKGPLKAESSDEDD